MYNALPYDMARCFGKDCDKKDQCQRHLTIELDPTQRTLSYFSSLKGNDKVCNDMIKDK